jgi:hypothetical protein
MPGSTTSSSSARIGSTKVSFITHTAVHLGKLSLIHSTHPATRLFRLVFALRDIPSIAEDGWSGGSHPGCVWLAGSCF